LRYKAKNGIVEGKEKPMPVIRPVEDLEIKPKDVIREVYLSREPVFLTKNGYGNLVLMNMDAWEDKNFDDFVCQKLEESCKLANSENPGWMTEEEVYGPIRKKIKDYLAAHHLSYAVSML
jgi:hypothetical protein